MPSDLDHEMAAILARLTASGGLLEHAPIARGNAQMPAFIHAPASLPAFFAHFCQLHAEAEFLVDGALRLTFAQTYAAAADVAARLMGDHALVKGERVGIAARNSACWVIAFMGVTMAGGCATLLNGWWTGDELAEGIALTGCRLVLADAERAARLEGRLGEAGAPALLIFGHGDPATSFAGLGAVQPPAAAPENELPELTAEDLATILFTSGSTGGAKGAWSDHRGVIQAVMNFLGQAMVALTLAETRGKAMPPQQTALVAIPLFHVTGLIPLLLLSFAIGRRLVVMPRWNVETAMGLIAAEKVTYFLGVPLMSFEIASHPDRARYDLTSCVYFAAGGAPRPLSHVSVIREGLPDAYPLLGYGLTETNAVGCGNINENYLAKPASTGAATAPLVDVAILDDAGSALPTGAQGEVAIRSVANCLGYWNNPEATAAAFTADGYFRTGDIGYLDEDGYLFIVDRAKDIVIRGGENISCLEVEQAIYAHPGVAEAAVFGVADARFGEVPIAVWVAKPGIAPSEAELRSALAGQLAGFKLPCRYWQAEGPLPRLGSEKLDKRAIKALYAALI